MGHGTLLGGDDLHCSGRVTERSSRVRPWTVAWVRVCQGESVLQARRTLECHVLLDSIRLVECRHVLRIVKFDKQPRGLWSPLTYLYN
jgi:hypothetical protein